MKKKLVILVTILGLILNLLVPSLVLADSTPPNPGDNTTNQQVFQECSDQAAAQSTFCTNANADKNNFTPLGPSGVITEIVQIIVWLVAIISVLMIVIGGFRYVVSGGDSNATAGAKNTILYAVIGLAVAIFAQIIVSFVLSQIK